jgi:AraC-like DNA-binding protein
MTERTVLASLAYPVLAAADQAHISLSDLALPPPLQQRDAPSGARISQAELFALWRAAGERSKNPVFGLYVAEHFSGPSTYDVVGFLARHSATVGEALGTFRRYGGLLKDDHSGMCVETGADGVHIVSPPLPRPAGWSRHVVESGIASYVALLRRWAALPHAAPRRVDFQHAAAADPAIYERFFGCRVNFSQPLDRLIWPAGVLDVPLATADPELSAFFRRQADAAMGALPPRDDTRERLRHALGEALRGGVPALGEAARALAMSPRTLQRRLAEQGVSYHDVLDEARRDAALRSLAAHRRTLRDAAEAAGFRDQKSFRRAFRRWTGSSPTTYQRAPLAP